MGRVEKTVFISYRRTNMPWALAIYQNLTMHGYDVFFDYDSIPSGDFEQVILGNIRARAHFLVVLTPSALERCDNPNDLLRREIETALDEKRNIVPVFLEGFDFGSPSISKYLTDKLENLKKYNGQNVPDGFFDEAMKRVRDNFLNVALEAVLHPISPLGKIEAQKQQKFEFGKKMKSIFSDGETSKVLRFLLNALSSTPIFGGVFSATATSWSEIKQTNLDEALKHFQKIRDDKVDEVLSNTSFIKNITSEIQNDVRSLEKKVSDIQSTLVASNDKDYVVAGYITFNPNEARIQESSKISSITDHGILDFTINFVIAFDNYLFNYYGSGPVSLEHVNLTANGMHIVLQEPAPDIVTIVFFEKQK